MPRSFKSIFAYSLLVTLAGGSLTLAASTPKAAEPPQRSTWEQYVENHPVIDIEYRYPGLKKQPVPQLADTSQAIRIPTGTAVIVRVMESINSKALTAASTVVFQVLNDVKVNNTVLIKAGTQAQAEVAISEQANYAGQAGKLVISDFSTRAVDGTYIPLRGTVSSQGQEKVVLSGALSFFICPAFLLMKGKEAIIPAGVEKTVYTATDVLVNTSVQ